MLEDYMLHVADTMITSVINLSVASQKVLKALLHRRLRIFAASKLHNSVIMLFVIINMLLAQFLLLPHTKQKST